jgi:hypothetical protein
MEKAIQIDQMTENLMTAITQARLRFALEVSPDNRPGLSAGKTEDGLWFVSFIAQHDGALTVLEDDSVLDRSDNEIYDLIDAAREDITAITFDRAA